MAHPPERPLLADPVHQQAAGEQCRDMLCQHQADSLHRQRQETRDREQAQRAASLQKASDQVPASFRTMWLPLLMLLCLQEAVSRLYQQHRADQARASAQEWPGALPHSSEGGLDGTKGQVKEMLADRDRAECQER